MSEQLKENDPVRVKEDHRVAAFRGDTGKIIKFVPTDKYWVQLKRNGKSMVHQNNLELIEEKK